MFHFVPNLLKRLQGKTSFNRDHGEMMEPRYPANAVDDNDNAFCKCGMQEKGLSPNKNMRRRHR